MKGVSGRELLPRNLEVDDAEFEALAQTLLGAGLSIRFRAKGFSMHPVIRDRDSLLVAPIAPQAVRVGDVVLFRRRRGELVVHRVLRRTVRAGQFSFLIKGDRSSKPDGRIPGLDVLGRVIGRERGADSEDMTRARWRLAGRILAWSSPFLPRLIRIAGGLRGMASSVGAFRA